MKRYYFTVFACASLSIAYSQNNQAILNNGKWNNNSTWGLGHSPQNGETAIVPADSILVVDDNIQITTDITLKVYGNLSFQVGKLRLTANSTILLYPGSTITSTQGTSADKIEIGGVSKFTGSDGTLSGPLMANSASTGFTFMPIILPVKFVAYNVSSLTNGEVSVKWSTAEEINASHYIIERSKDGYTWQTIGKVDAAQKLFVLNNYSYTDKDLINGIVYYRVKQVDRDGHFIYTSVKSIRSNSTIPEIKISSVANNIVAEFSKEINGKAKAQLISLSGQVVAQQTLCNPSGYIIFNKGSLKGNYILQINNGRDISIAKQIFIH